MTNLSIDRAAFECLATLIRQHWAIESRRWLRDTVYYADNSYQMGSPVMAALRNLAIGAIRLTGRRTSPKQPAPQVETWATIKDLKAHHMTLEMTVSHRPHTCRTWCVFSTR